MPETNITLTHRQKMLTFFGVLLAMFLSSLDNTIVSTALSSIVADLKGLDRFSWVATAYLVASTALVPIYAKLADMYSRRNVVERAINKLKHYRRVATRYDKTARNFYSFICIAAAVINLK